MDYSAVFGNADGLSWLPAGPDQCFDRQNYGKINMTELLQVEKLEELPVKASDLATETNRDPVLKQVKNFILKGWPKQVTSITDTFNMFVKCWPLHVRSSQRFHSHFT